MSDHAEASSVRLGRPSNAPKTDLRQNGYLVAHPDDSGATVGAHLSSDLAATGFGTIRQGGGALKVFMHSLQQ